MKRAVCLLLVFICLICTLTACRQDKTTQLYKDTLVITNEDSDFLGAKARFNDVITALTTKISTLEGCHNTSISNSEPDNYFLNENYILTAFDPFNIPSFAITDKFTSELTSENAAEVFKDDAAGSDIKYSADGDSVTLQFMSEELIRTWKTEYNSRSDSFHFTYTEDTPPQEKTIEFLEFVTVSKGVYAIRSNKTKCMIAFDENNNIESFSCSQLKDGTLSPDNSIYGASQAALTSFESNINKGKLSSFDRTYEFTDGVLTRNDTIEGKTRKIMVVQEQYESAFLIS